MPLSRFRPWKDCDANRRTMTRDSFFLDGDTRAPRRVGARRPLPIHPYPRFLQAVRGYVSERGLGERARSPSLTLRGYRFPMGRDARQAAGTEEVSPDETRLRATCAWLDFNVANPPPPRRRSSDGRPVAKRRRQQTTPRKKGRRKTRRSLGEAASRVRRPVEARRTTTVRRMRVRSAREARKPVFRRRRIAGWAVREGAGRKSDVARLRDGEPEESRRTCRRTRPGWPCAVAVGVVAGRNLRKRGELRRTAPRSCISILRAGARTRKSPVSRRRARLPRP